MNWRYVFIRQVIDRGYFKRDVHIVGRTISRVFDFHVPSLWMKSYEVTCSIFPISLKVTQRLYNAYEYSWALFISYFFQFMYIRGNFICFWILTICRSKIFEKAYNKLGLVTKFFTRKLSFVWAIEICIPWRMLCIF